MIKTSILSPLVTEIIPGTDGRLVRYVEPYIFQSQVLYNLGLQYVRQIPINFICDLESIPWFRGSCPEAGGIHDLACRIDFDPKVTKKVAADLYLEFMRFCYARDNQDGLKGKVEQVKDKSLEYLKYYTVRIWPNYFHKLNTLATLEEVRRVV